MNSLSQLLRLYAQQFEDQHALQNMTIALREAAAEIERLTAEVQTWVDHTKTAVWSDSEQCKLLEAENERLRAALGEIVKPGGADDFWECVDIARAALEDGNG